MSLGKLTADNYDQAVFRFQDRQAGVTEIYDPEENLYTYNAYCLEIKLMKELFTVEYDFLEDALELINSEFGSWELREFAAKDSGCGSCVAK